MYRGSNRREKNEFFEEGNQLFILDTSVENLCSGPPIYPQVTFNKCLEGYHTVPSAHLYYRHTLYGGVPHHCGSLVQPIAWA